MGGVGEVRDVGDERSFVGKKGIPFGHNKKRERHASIARDSPHLPAAGGRAVGVRG